MDEIMDVTMVEDAIDSEAFDEIENGLDDIDVSDPLIDTEAVVAACIGGVITLGVVKAVPWCREKVKAIKEKVKARKEMMAEAIVVEDMDSEENGKEENEENKKEEKKK